METTDPLAKWPLPSQPPAVGRVAPVQPVWAQLAERLVRKLIHHWLLVLSLILGFWVSLPWLAPVFMWAGWEPPARVIYFVYSFVCHQLPQRSWFLFGQTFTPSLLQVDQLTGAGNNPMLLRQFIGNADIGWKVAWSDRMNTLYGGLFLFTVLYGLTGSKIRPLRWPTAVLLLVPMVLDGGSHMISDFWGLGLGFRDNNAWLAALTNNSLPISFYAGDAWGSFNSLARIITGFLAAYAFVMFLVPRVRVTQKPTG